VSEHASDPRNPEAGDVPVEDVPVEELRRTASAELDGGGEAGSAVALRDAMDPANQSLGDALRLSYRVLQLGILALVATFLFSGFQTVREGAIGVKTLFGGIVGTPGDEALPPGLHPFWPYPVGQIVTVELRRPVEVDQAFWPSYRRGATTLEEATDAADLSKHLQPGTDGSLLTADGDLAHLQLQAEYVVEDPTSLLRTLRPEMVPQVVQLALERGAVVAAANFTLNELTELREQPTIAIREAAQQVLDEIACGIELASVTAPMRITPLAVRKSYAEVQTQRERVKTAVERARQQAATTLTAAAGPAASGQLIRLIIEYENSLTLGDDAAADEVLARIGERFAAGDVGGEAAMIVARAEAAISARRSQLAKEVRRLEGLLPAYRENPRQLARQLWLDAVRSVMEDDEAEVFSVPPALAAIDLAVDSSPDVMQLRRRRELERKKAEADAAALSLQPFTLDTRTIMIDQAGRRLERDASRGLGNDG
jgi:regulator of protease activity HflC (stomatin/prohibitin superfamily)